MFRLILIVLGWPLVVVLLVSGYQWYRAQTAVPPGLMPPVTAVDYAVVREVAGEALDAFGRLPPSEQEAIVTSLDATLMRPREWVDRLYRGDHRIVCLGETHRTATRTFIAETFLPRYRADTLLLETHPDDLALMQRQVRAGEAYVPLLDADIGRVLRAARRGNPAVRIAGIEETRDQYRVRERYEGSRDRSLARNFWSRFRPGDRHVVVYGALHCANEAGWFYRYLRMQSPPRDAVPMVNVRILGAAEFEPLAAVVGFLDALGMARGDFVVAHPDRLHPRLREWFGLLDQVVLRHYDALVVFRGNPGRPTLAAHDGRDDGRGTAPPPGPRALRIGARR